MLEIVNDRQVAIRFFHEFMDERVIEVLEQEYQYSWQDYYKEMEETWQLYPLDFYKDYRDLVERNTNNENAYKAMQSEYEKSQKEIRRLIREIQGMSRTVSWKITQPLRTAKRFISGNGH